MRLLTIETSSLGDRSYVVDDGRHAAVIDPQRDLDRILPALEGLELVAILETHVHNDYVSGGLELARRTGAAYHLSADESLAFEYEPIKDGDRIRVGDLVLRAVHTPGHTPTHLSYVVSDGAGDRAVFTGGGLLFGSVGRTDLIAPEMTEELSRHQFRSARRLASELGDDVEVLPTHGFGSFCSSGETTGATSSTIGQERRDNQALRSEDEDEFVRELIAGLDAYPAYYAHMGPANRRGPDPVDLDPPAVVDATELARRIHAGDWVVDLRSRRTYAAGHLVGTINVEVDESFCTYLGWLLPWGTPVTLIGQSAEQVAEAQRQMVRIGIDRPAGRAHTGDLDGHLTASYRTATFAEASEASSRDDVVVLDVRRRLEWDDGHLDEAVHVPLHELLQRLDDVPAGEVWVHCQSGYRAAIAASLLERSGRDVVLVDQDFPGSP